MLKQCSMCKQTVNAKTLTKVGREQSRQYCTRCVGEAEFVEELRSTMSACDPHAPAIHNARVVYAKVLDHIIHDVVNPCDSIQGLLYGLELRRARL